MKNSKKVNFVVIKMCLFMTRFPEEFCGLWFDEDGKAIYIVKIEPLVLKTAVIFNLFEQLKKGSLHIDKHLKQLLTHWVYDKQRKIHRLQVEAGIENLGPTYNLYISSVGETPTSFNFTSFILEEIRLLPEVQMGLYDDYDDDLGVNWGFPYKDYQKAPEIITDKFKLFVKFNENGTIK